MWTSFGLNPEELISNVLLKQSTSSVNNVKIIWYWIAMIAIEQSRRSLVEDWSRWRRLRIFNRRCSLIVPLFLPKQWKKNITKRIVRWMRNYYHVKHFIGINIYFLSLTEKNIAPSRNSVLSVKDYCGSFKSCGTIVSPYLFRMRMSVLLITIQ